MLPVRWRCAWLAGGSFVGRCWRLRGGKFICLFSCRIVPRASPRVASKPHLPTRLALLCLIWSPRVHRVRQRLPATHHSTIASPGSARNAAGRLKTAATDPARSLVTHVDLAGAPRPPASPRDPFCSKSRLWPPRGTVRQKKEKISPVRLLPRRLFHLGAHGSTSYIAARSS